MCLFNNFSCTVSVCDRMLLAEVKLESYCKSLIAEGGGLGEAVLWIVQS